MQAVLHAGTFHRHLVARQYKKSRAKRILVAGLMLTSMVDMFSLLVIFLLQSFSSSPVTINMNKGITLPPSISATAAKDAPVFSVSATEVVLDDQVMGSTQDLAKNPRPILDKLDAIRQLWMKDHAGENFPGDIHLQADQDLASPLVSQFMSMMVSKGFASVHLTVVSGQAR